MRGRRTVEILESGLRTAFGSLLLSFCLLPSVSGDTTCVYRVELPGALPVMVKTRDGQRTDFHPMVVDIAVRSGVCDRVVWGASPYIPGLEHTGEVAAYSLEDDKAIISVRVDIISNRSEPVFLGGTATYDLDLRLRNSVVEGTFRGVCVPLIDKAEVSRIEARFGYGPDQPDPDAPQRRAFRSLLQGEMCSTDVVGNAVGVILPLRDAPQDFRPPESGEHPRLLFRRADLPRLRACASTVEGGKRLREIEQMLEVPGGKALGQVSDPAVLGACHAFLYQVTGDPDQAVKAGNLVRWALFSRYEQGANSRHGYTLLGVGLAYDMCGETWSPSDRQFVYAYLEEYTRQHAQRHDQADLLNTDDHFMFANACDGFVYGERDFGAVQSRIGAIVGSLAILNDRPVCLAHPFEIERLAPLEGFAPWYGVPVLRFESDVMPRHWLLNGPFLRDEVDAAVKEYMGGYEKMRPEPGGAIKVDGIPLAWRQYRPAGHNTASPRLDVKHCGRYFGMAYDGGYGPSVKVIEKWKQRFVGKQIPMSVLLYTVISNDVERIVEALPNWRSPSLSSRMWINGRPVEDGALFQLRPGLYTVTAEVPVYGTSSVQSPKLREYDRDMLRVARSVPEEAKALAGPTISENRILLNAVAMRRSVERWMERNLSADGWNPQGYSMLSPMLMAHRNVMGIDVAGSEGMTRCLEWVMRLRGHPAGTGAHDVLQATYGIMPQAMKPYARWCLDQDSDRTSGGVLDAILAFINMHPDAPATSPEKVFSLTHNFECSGRYVFNSGFGGSNSLVAMVMTGAGRESVPAAAGGVALSGFGGTWLGWRMPEQAGDREFTGLVPMELFPVGRTRILHEQSEPDGSGVLTIRQETFVRGLLKTWLDKESGLISREIRMGRTPVPNVYMVRSVGVDYSRKSGAPMLVAIADRVQLARKREVAWRLALAGSGTPRLQPGPRTDEKKSERSFRLGGPGGAGLQVTYAAPEDFEFRLRNDSEILQGGVVDAVVFRRSTIEEDAARRSALVAKDTARIRETARIGTRDEVDDHGARPVNAMELADNLLEEIKEGEEGPPAPVTFLVVLTLQEGPAPTVETLTRGEFPSVRVGERVVRFDGTNIVFGVPAQIGTP